MLRDHYRTGEVPPPVERIPPTILADEAILKLREVLDRVADFHQTRRGHRPAKRSALDWDMVVNLGDLCDIPDK